MKHQYVILLKNEPAIYSSYILLVIIYDERIQMRRHNHPGHTGHIEI